VPEGVNGEAFTSEMGWEHIMPFASLNQNGNFSSGLY